MNYCKKSLSISILLFLCFSKITAQDGVVKSFYPDNTPRTEIAYVAGILDGNAYWYYPNGNLMIEKEYSNGRLNGMVREFYENGLLKIEYSVKGGIKEGTQRVFYENGALKEISIFEKGSEIRKEKFEFDKSYRTLPEAYMVGNRQQEIIRKKKQELICDVEICPLPIDGLKIIQENLIYPEHALLYGLEGTVVLIATVDSLGLVKNTEVIQHLGLGCDEAAQAAVKKTKFIPGQDNGKAVTSHVTLKIDFKIVDKNLVQTAQSHELLESNSDLQNFEIKSDSQILSEHKITKEQIDIIDQNKPSRKIPEIKCNEDNCPYPENGILSIYNKLSVPFIAKRLKLEGEIVVEFSVDQFGITNNTKIISGIGYGCDEAVESAIMQTKFHPAKKNNNEVDSKAVIYFPFSYQNN